jgi:hypothetical protein
MVNVASTALPSMETLDLGQGHSLARSPEVWILDFPSEPTAEGALPVAYVLLALACLVGCFDAVACVMCLAGPLLMLYVLGLGARHRGSPYLEVRRRLAVLTEIDGYRAALRRHILVDNARSFDAAEVERIVVTRFSPSRGVCFYRVNIVFQTHVVSAPGSADLAHAHALAQLLAGALGRDPGPADAITACRGQGSSVPWAAAFLAGLGAMVGAVALFLALASGGVLPPAALATFAATVLASQAYIAVVRLLRRRDDVAAIRDTFQIEPHRDEA